MKPLFVENSRVFFETCELVYISEKFVEKSFFSTSFNFVKARKNSASRLSI